MGFEWIISEGCPICFDIGGFFNLFLYRRVVKYVLISEGFSICFDIGGLSNMF